MAKSPRKPSGKSAGGSKPKDEVTDAEILSENEDPAQPLMGGYGADATDTVPRETVPEDSDYDSSSVPAITPSADPVLVETSEDVAAADDVMSAAADTASDQKEGAASASHDPEPETPKEAHAAPVAAQSAPQPSGGGLFGSILGGLIAGGIGFALAMYFFPQGWQERDDSALRALETAVADQESTIADQTDQISALQAGLDELPPQIGAATEPLAADIAQQTEGLAALAARLDSLTQGDGTTKLPDDVQILLNTQRDALAALQSQVEGLTDEAEARLAEAAAQERSAEEAEARVKARGAMQEVRLALTSGAPFVEALPIISGATEIPQALQNVADTGVPTSAELRDSYPDAARAALAVAIREETGDDTQSRFQLFLKDQLRARSLTPQDGDDADAVLSRAEAAVKAEDYAAALQEIEALPETAQEAFADWRAMTEARIGAVNGYEAVADALNEN